MDAIVLAAGLGIRTKLDYPKQLMMLNGKPLFVHILDRLRAIADIENIIIAVIPERLLEFVSLTQMYGHGDVLCVPGGESRQESVRRALQFCETDRVLVHEATRPFFSGENISAMLALNADAVVPCVPLIYAAIRKDGSYLDRDDIMCIQLPQVFRTELLKEAHEKGRGKQYSEDSELVYMETGIPPTVVEGWAENIKITMPSDIRIAELIFNHLGLDNYLNNPK